MSLRDQLQDWIGDLGFGGPPPPLRRDGFGPRFSVILAALAFVVVAAAELGLSANAGASRWTGPLRNTATLRIATDMPGAGPADERRDQAMAILTDLPGVKGMRPISRDEAAALAGPWLSDPKAVELLPLPLLVDVSVDRALLDLAEAADALKSVPGAVLDDHRRWMEAAGRLATAAATVAFGLAGLTALAAALLTAMAAQAALAAQRDVVEVLHLAGGGDGWISFGCARRVFIFAIAGAGAGTTAAVLAVRLVGWRVASVAPEAGLYFDPGWTGWAAAALIAPGLAGLAAVVAYFAARAELRRWP